MPGAMARRSTQVILLVCLAGLALAEDKPKGQQTASDASLSSDLSSAAGKSSTSACAQQCFQQAKTLGFERVAGDSLACFMPYKGKRLSTYDCCDKAELLLGVMGPMANCMCCPEFAKAMLDAVPYDKLGTTAQGYLEKLNLCRVPILGQASCAAAASTPVTPPKERAAVATASAPAPAVGTKQTEQLQPRPLIAAFNLTGLYPFVGFDSRFDPGVMGAQGRAAVDAGQISQITVVGASPLYNDYITGFVMWIERETPRYNTPKLPQLPPLPDKYKEDVAWVASLRRGPYPDLIKHRPEEYSPQRTDPLQNGQISSLPPGPAFSGRLSQLSKPPAAPAPPGGK
ncbi:hypothetical protein OEZ86_000061 [Tetradesmus obliquus]|nr:hypothetical protein OEZ86_000061 [Tetradesmus obliquus]